MRIDLGNALKLLADPTRLRILALVEETELSVGDLARSLGLSQSRVSNHLRLLREAELLAERHRGTKTYLRLAPAENGTQLVGRLWSRLAPEIDALPERGADRSRLAAVLAEREGGDLFDRLADEWDKIAPAFETGQGRERTGLHLLPSDYTVLDLGCGTGYMAQALLGQCERLILVDRSARMLEEAEKRLVPRAGTTALDLRRGEVDRLPLEDEEVDGALCGLVLHHLESRDACLREVWRVLRPGGAFAILELAPHREAWMHSALGDRHLGLEPTDVMADLERAGFADLVLDPVQDRYRPRRPGSAPDDETVSLTLYIVRGRKPPSPRPNP